jgi:hypothetical protein
MASCRRFHSDVLGRECRATLFQNLGDIGRNSHGSLIYSFRFLASAIAAARLRSVATLAAFRIDEFRDLLASWLTR